MLFLCEFDLEVREYMSETDPGYEHGVRLVEAKDATEAEAIVRHHLSVDDPYGTSKLLCNFYAHELLKATPDMLNK